MEKRSLNLTPFTRIGLPTLGEGIELIHCPEALAVEEKLRYEQIALEYCEPDKKGKLSVQNHSKTKLGVVPFDIELAQHFIVNNSSLFIRLVEKTPGIKGDEVMILCTGTTLYMAGIPTRNIYFKYFRKERVVEFGDIGNAFKGILPKTYRLVYYTGKDQQVA